MYLMLLRGAARYPQGMSNVTRFVSVLALAAACTRSGSSQPSEEAAAKSTAASNVQARSAPLPASAPVAPAAAQGPGGPPPPTAPRPIEPGTEGARALVERFAKGEVTAEMFAPMTTVAYVDYSASPRTGVRGKTEKGYCMHDGGIDELLGTLGALIKARSGQIAQALEDDEVACNRRGADRVRCRIGALGDGEATLTFEFENPGPILVGFSKHETFMIQDDAAIAKDESRRDRAFKTLNATACEPERTRDEETYRQRAELEAAGEL